MWIKDQTIRVIVTSAVDKGKYGELRFVDSRKVKATGLYVKSYFSFWTVAGTAYQTFPTLVRAIENSGTFEGSDRKKGVQIIIKAFSIGQEKYTDKEGNEIFSKQPRFTVWDWDFVESSNKDMDTPSTVETPFDKEPEIEWPEE